MSLSPRQIWPLLQQTYRDWSEDKASRLAAALAFYTALSLAPLVVLCVAVASLAFGDEAARGEITQQFRGVFGAQGAAAVETVLASSRGLGQGLLATITSLAVLLLGASGVFGELQDALNTVWEVKPKPGLGLKGFLVRRFLSFTMVLGVAFLLLVSLVLTAALAAASELFSRLVGGVPVVWQVVNQVIAFAVATGLFALIFKVVPDVKVPWRDVWVGALATALMFTLGKLAIGLYLGHSSTASAYGAAGSLVAMLIWVYYSAQILFFGAELTQAYAVRHGSRVEPARFAVPATAGSPAAPGPRVPARS